MAAGSKISDDKQEYQFTYPYVTPSGHQFTFYDTPSNQRLVIRHSSGSHMEFKADGSVFIKSVGDLHTASSIASTQSDVSGGADNTTMRHDTDYTMDVGGRLRIKCSTLDFEIGSTGRIIAGTDLITSANNMVNKATESISIEGTKSIYMDTKEMRERVVSRQTEAGTKEGASGSSMSGGLNVMKVYGNTVIQNDDENGGITIASKGYLNLVAGAERVDLVGKFTTTPSKEALSTFTTKVFASKGSLDVSTKPGDVYFESEAGAYYNYGKKVVGSSTSAPDGFKVDIGKGNCAEAVQDGDRIRAVSGDETIGIVGEQIVVAKKIFLN